MYFEPLRKEHLPPEIDSKEEVYFEWWLTELLALGYVNSYSRAIKYVLLNKVDLPCLKSKPTKKEPNRLVPSTKNILKSWTYTPDYNILWDKKSLGLFCTDIETPTNIINHTYFYAKKTENGYLSVVDVKPIQFRAGITSTSVKFPHIQKLMMNVYDIYVNKSCPTGKGSLFEQTFTPNRFLLQDVNPKSRRISKWSVISAEKFIKNNSKLNDT
jgi:hypothetical protein